MAFKACVELGRAEILICIFVLMIVVHHCTETAGKVLDGDRPRLSNRHISCPTRAALRVSKDFKSPADLANWERKTAGNRPVEHGRELPSACADICLY